MSLINEAFSILSDEEKRKTYNEILQNWPNKKTISKNGLPIIDPDEIALDGELLGQFRQQL
jgi:curved DNA-binding protein CbpA